MIANTGGNDTRHSIELSKQAQAQGVDALLAVGPYYNKPPQAGLIGHFSAIADAVEIPIVIYNIPGRTAVNILPETIATLSDHPRIAGVKESSGDLMQIGELITKVAKDFDVYSGDDHLTLPIMAIGGCGVVSVASHVAGEQIRAMCDAYTDGDVLQAAQLHQAVLPLIKALFAVTSPIPVKAAMQRFGFATGACRPPLCALTPEQDRCARSRACAVARPGPLGRMSAPALERAGLQILGCRVDRVDAAGRVRASRNSSSSTGRLTSSRWAPRWRTSRTTTRAIAR